MANERARNIQDATLNPAAFALPTTLLAAGAKTSAAIDLGADTVKPESIELEISVPALNATIAPAAATVGVAFYFETSTTSVFTAVARTIQLKTIAGSGSGIAATVLRTRLPSDCERYVRAGVALSTTCTDASAVSATVSVRL